MRYTTFSECCEEVRARTELVFDARAPARLREMCALYQAHITSEEEKRRQEPALERRESTALTDVHAIYTSILDDIFVRLVMCALVVQRI